jgi:hypothetical protein
MSIAQLEWSKRLKNAGEVLCRGGLAQRAVKIMVDLVTQTSSYKEAMIAAGRLKAIAAAARYDGYWTEKVEEGFHKEMAWLEAEAGRQRAGAAPSPDLGVWEIADAELLERAVKSARSPTAPVGYKHARWVAVMDVFQLGSTYAHQLCRRFDLDPDEKVMRPRRVK